MSRAPSRSRRRSRRSVLRTYRRCWAASRAEVSRLLSPARGDVPVAAQRRLARRCAAAHVSPCGRARMISVGSRSRRYDLRGRVRHPPWRGTTNKPGRPAGLSQMGFLALTPVLLWTAAALAAGVLITYLRDRAAPRAASRAPFCGWPRSTSCTPIARGGASRPASCCCSSSSPSRRSSAALARPFVLSADASGLDAIVLLDVSASMQATDVAADSLRGGARPRPGAMIDALQPGQTLSLVSLGAEPRVVAPRTDDHAFLQQALASAAAHDPVGESARALSLAASLAEGHPEAQVVVVGSGASIAHRCRQRSHWRCASSASARPPPNLAIAAFGTRLIDGHLAALARVANYGAERRTATLNLRSTARASIRASCQRRRQAPLPRRSGTTCPSSARVLEAHLAEPDAVRARQHRLGRGRRRPPDAGAAGQHGQRVPRARARPATRRRRSRARRPTTTPPMPWRAAVRPGRLRRLRAAASCPPRAVCCWSIRRPATRCCRPVRTCRSRASSAARRPPAAGRRVAEGVARQPRPPTGDYRPGPTACSRRPRRRCCCSASRPAIASPCSASTSMSRTCRSSPAFPILIQHLLDWLVPGGSVATPVVHVGEAAALVPLPEATQRRRRRPRRSLRSASRRRSRRRRSPRPSSRACTRSCSATRTGHETRSQFAANFVDPGRVAPEAGASVAISAERRPLRTSRGGLLAPREIWQIAAVIGLVAARRRVVGVPAPVWEPDVQFANPARAAGPAGAAAVAVPGAGAAMRWPRCARGSR